MSSPGPSLHFCFCIGRETKQASCADPESFVRGGPTLIFFFFIRGERIQYQ